MAAVAARAGVMKLTHAPTQAELHSLMRFGPRSAARARDGLDLELFFTPALAARLAAAATHPRVLSAAAPLRVAEMIVRDTDEAPLRSAPALCLLYADSLEAGTFLRGGACFEEIALDVTEAGLAMALHSAPVEVGLSHPGPPSPSVPGEWHAGIADVRRELLAAFAGTDPHLGLYGAFGYDLAFQFEPVRLRHARPADQRDLVLHLPDQLYVLDRKRETATCYRYDFEVAGASTAGECPAQGMHTRRARSRLAMSSWTAGGQASSFSPYRTSIGIWLSRARSSVRSVAVSRYRAASKSAFGSLLFIRLPRNASTGSATPSATACGSR